MSSSTAESLDTCRMTWPNNLAAWHNKANLLIWPLVGEDNLMESSDLTIWTIHERSLSGYM